MLVTKVEAFPLRLAYEEPIADARSVITHKATVLIRIETESGGFGWGEAAAFGDVAQEVACVLNSRLSGLVLGTSAHPRDLRKLLKRATAHYGQRGLVVSAISGLEIAAWDALARTADLPLCQVLGAVPRPVGIYAGAGYYSPGATRAEDVRNLKNSIGASTLDCRGIKIKVGRHGIDDDLERVRVAREALGASAILIADANNAYTFHEAVKFAKQAEPYGLLFLEEPIEFGRPADSADLRRASPIDIAGYELEMTYAGFLPYIEQRAVDVLQPDCIWSGGILECLDIAAAAERVGIAVSPHNFASVVSTAANYHFVCATGGELLEVDGTRSPLLDIALELDGRSMLNGFLTIRDEPGLGVTPDIDHLRELVRTSSASLVSISLQGD